MIRKLPDAVLLIVFMLIISAPLFSPMPTLAWLWEKNGLSQSDLSIPRFAKALVGFPDIYSSYFSDHYLLHQQQVDAFQSMRYHVLHETVFPNVIIGKQDWLYYTGENNIKDYECAFPFSSDELVTVKERLLDWDTQLDALGIELYVVIAPNKETVYPQYLPDQIRPLQNACRIDQVMETLEPTHLSVLDLRAAIQAAALVEQVYHRTDTHWNDMGALHAIREMLALVSEDFPQLSMPEFDDYEEEIRSFSGDLAVFLPADDRFVEQETTLAPNFKPSTIIKEGEGRNIVSSIPGSTLPSAVIIRDSFTDALIPFLSEHFSRVKYIYSVTIDLDMVKQENPDIVIYEIAQRYLTMLR